MMQQRKILILLIILVVLLGVAWLSGTFDSAPSTIDAPEIELEAGLIDRIEITRAEETFVLEKSEGTWELVSPVAALADSITVSSLVRNLGDLEIESVVSSNPDRYGNYGVDSTGSEILVHMGNTMHRLVLSGQGPDFSSVYLRMDGDPRVFAAVPRFSIPTSMDRWRDKRIFSAASQSVVQARVITPDHSFEMQKDSLGWLLDVSGEESYADSAAVARWLRKFSPFRADGFLEYAAADADPTHKLTLRLSDGSTFSLEMTKREHDVAATFSGEPGTIYKLYSSRLTTLFPDPSTLRH